MITRTDQRQLDDIIRRAMHAVMREYLAPIVETEAFQARLASAIAGTLKSTAAIEPAAAMARAVTPQAIPPAAGAPASPFTSGEGSARRLTPAGAARVAELLAAGVSDSNIAREVGIALASVRFRRNGGGQSSAPCAITSQVERDLARAGKLRAYQRELKRRQRAAGHSPGPEAARPPAPKAAPVLVAPVLAAPVLAAPKSMSAAVPAGQRPQNTAREPAPMDPAQLEPVPASYEDAMDWLFAHLQRERMDPAEIETRLAALTTRQLVATCNAQRVKAGLSPYALVERAA